MHGLSLLDADSITRYRVALSAAYGRRTCVHFTCQRRFSRGTHQEGPTGRSTQLALIARLFYLLGSAGWWCEKLRTMNFEFVYLELWLLN